MQVWTRTCVSSHAKAGCFIRSTHFHATSFKCTREHGGLHPPISRRLHLRCYSANRSDDQWTWREGGAKPTHVEHGPRAQIGGPGCCSGIRQDVACQLRQQADTLWFVQGSRWRKAAHLVVQGRRQSLGRRGSVLRHPRVHRAGAGTRLLRRPSRRWSKPRVSGWPDILRNKMDPSTFI